MSIDNLHGFNTNQDIITLDKTIKLLIQKDSFNEAFFQVDQYINKYPNKPELYCIKADIYNSMNLFNFASECYSNVLKLDTNNALAFDSHGFSLVQNGNFIDAIDDFNTIINNTNLNYRQFVLNSAYNLRALSVAAIGDWNLLKSYYTFVDNNFIIYLYSIDGKVDKDRLEKCMLNYEVLPKIIKYMLYFDYVS